MNVRCYHISRRLAVTEGLDLNGYHINILDSYSYRCQALFQATYWSVHARNAPLRHSGKLTWENLTAPRFLS